MVEDGSDVAMLRGVLPSGRAAAGLSKVGRQ
jgi:hypothetical protein